MQDLQDVMAAAEECICARLIRNSHRSLQRSAARQMRRKMFHVRNCGVVGSARGPHSCADCEGRAFAFSSCVRQDQASVMEWFNSPERARGSDGRSSYSARGQWSPEICPGLILQLEL